MPEIGATPPPAHPGEPLPPELDPRRGHRAQPRSHHRGHGPVPRRRAGRGRSRALIRIGRTVAALVSLTVLVASGYAWATYHNFSTSISRIDAIPKAKQGGSNVDGADQNILIVGNDDRQNMTDAEVRALHTGRNGGSMNTDTMMILHVPADGAKATVISLPRDSWVNIPGFGMNKLNAAYGFGYRRGHSVAAGARLLTQTIHNITGLTIDHYVQVSLLAFYRISLAIGGVDVCLLHATRDSHSGLKLPTGHSVIQGVQALGFVRQRHGLPRGDLDRIVRQQYFLSVAFAKIASAGTLLNPYKLQRLLTAVSSSLQVDQGLDLLKLATQAQNLTAGQVRFTTIPVAGTPTITYNGYQVSIVQLNTAAMPAFIAKVIGQPSAYTKAKPASPASVTVTVLNASGTAGAAARSTDALKQAGFRTGTPRTTATTTRTVIEYPAGMESQAKAVASRVPGAPATVSVSAHQITLVLGTDRKKVGPATRAPSASSSTSGQTKTRTAAHAGCIY